MKKLSVITVCLNEEKGIEKTIQSVQSQTFVDYEHIIIDGGSTDKTLEIIEKYKDKIDIVVSEKDNGIYDAMNKGIKLANGEYLYFLNAGDYLVSPNVFQYVFQRNPKEDIVYGDGIIIWNNRTFRKASPKKISKLFMFMDTLPHQGAYIKKSILQKAGNYNLKYKIAADYDFFLKALYKFSASYKYIPISFAVNNLEGVSNQAQFNEIKELDRKNAQNLAFTKNTLILFRLFKPFIYYLYKYPKYLFYLLMSRISKKFLRIV